MECTIGGVHGAEAKRINGRYTARAKGQGYRHESEDTFIEYVGKQWCVTCYDGKNQRGFLMCSVTIDIPPVELSDVPLWDVYDAENGYVVQKNVHVSTTQTRPMSNHAMQHNLLGENSAKHKQHHKRPTAGSERAGGVASAGEAGAAARGGEDGGQNKRAPCADMPPIQIAGVAGKVAEKINGRYTAAVDVVAGKKEYRHERGDVWIKRVNQQWHMCWSEKGKNVYGMRSAGNTDMELCDVTSWEVVEQKGLATQPSVSVSMIQPTSDQLLCKQSLPRHGHLLDKRGAEHDAEQPPLHKQLKTGPVQAWGASKSNPASGVDVGRSGVSRVVALAQAAVGNVAQLTKGMFVSSEGMVPSEDAKTQDEVRKLQRQVAHLRRENEELVQERRAARSEAAAGNNNINSDFPFKQENKKSYEKIIENALDLFDPCLGEQNIPWACAASKHIFEMCYTQTQKRIMDAQQDFKTKMLVVEGGKEVSEWENTRFSMVKLQRATRTRILGQLTHEMESQGQQFRTYLERPDLDKLMLHQDYKKYSLEKFVNALAKVSLLPECTPTLPRGHTNAQLIVRVVLTGSDGGGPR